MLIRHFSFSSSNGVNASKQHQRQRRIVVFSGHVDRVVSDTNGGVRQRAVPHVVPQSGRQVAGHRALQGCQEDPKGCGTGNF